MKKGKKISEEQKIKMQERREESAKKIFDICGFGMRYNSHNWIVKDNLKTFYFSSFLKALEDIAGIMGKRGVVKSKDLEAGIEAIKKENGYTIVKRACDDEQIKSYMNDGDKLGYLWRQGFFDGADPL